jgi:hypothetical protein
LRGFGKAPAAREWMAATQNEGLGELVGVLGAVREGCVAHIPVEEVRVVVASGGDGGELGVEEEIWWSGGGGGGGFGRGVGGGVEAREVVDGGAYGLELVEEVVRDWRWRRGSLGCLKRGREVVKGEDVGGHHGYEKQQVQTHCETHRTLTPVDFNGFAYFSALWNLDLACL